jgi:hypothetical protein
MVASELFTTTFSFPALLPAPVASCRISAAIEPISQYRNESDQILRYAMKIRVGVLALPQQNAI